MEDDVARIRLKKTFGMNLVAGQLASAAQMNSTGSDRWFVSKLLTESHWTEG